MMEEATPPTVTGSAHTKPSKASSIDRMISAIMAPPKGGEQTIEGSGDEPATEPAAPAAGGPPEPADGEPGDAPAETPAEAPAEPAKPKTAESARLAKALVDLEKEQAARLKLEKRFKDIEAQLRDAESDPAKALALGKHDPEALIQAMLDGKVKRKADEPEQTPEQKRLAELEARLAKAEQESQEAKAKEAYFQEVAVINGKIKDRAIAGLFPWAADKIYENFYAEHERTGDTPDLDAVIEQFEAGVAGELRLALSSERAIETLIASDPKVREMVVKALKLPATETRKTQPAQRDSQRAHASGDGPSVITQRMASEIPERRVNETRTPDERRARALDILLAQKGKKS